MGIVPKRDPGVLRDDHNIIVLDTQTKLNVWEHYIKRHFDDRWTTKNELKTSKNAPEITRAEVEHAIRIWKSGKAVGPDEVYCELLKLLDVHLIQILLNLFNDIYKIGNILHDVGSVNLCPHPKEN